MSKKLIYLASFLLMCGVQTSDAAGPDDNLVLYLPFDEGSGAVTEDKSPAAHQVTLEGSYAWAAGQSGQAVEFTGGRAVVADSDPLNVPLITAMAWVNPATITTNVAPNHYTDLDPIYEKRGSGDDSVVLGLTGGDGVHFYIDTGSNQNLSVPDAGVQTGEWQHIAGTFDGTTSRAFLNGEQIGEMAASGTIITNTNLVTLAGRTFQGIVDEVKVFDRALTADEIRQAMNAIPAGAASGPNPANEATDVPRDVVLSWTPGEYAPAVNGHIVYLGESFADVNNGVGGVTVSAASYAPPQRLAFETTYYWRVDEVNAPPDSTVFPGVVWSFTTEPVGYPIDGANIIATASSVGQADVGPENTINGSGLDENDLHSAEPTDMWLSNNEPQGAWIQYEFDKAYKLHAMWVWNSNQIFEGLFGFGIKDVTVEYSTDGAEWAAVADVSEFARAPGAAGYAHDTTVGFGGVAAKYVKLTATSNWGGVLPQFGLSEVRFFYIPVSAAEPSPDTGAADVDVNVTLAWRAGREAATHNVYLSTNEQAVSNATAPVVGVTNASYSAALDLGKTYYWRVDEVNEAEMPTTWQGDVWSFSTIGYLVVDGFEDYNDWPPYEIYTTWVDGYENPANGSQVGYLTPPSVETTIVHSGAQSMPLIYSNTGGAMYSEATRTFATPQDWTRNGIQTLGLWFYGTEGNTGQLYIKINGTKIPYDGQASNLARPGWRPWNINLTASGLNLQSVTSLTIGIDGNAAAGTLYVDDIRLYGQAAAPSEPRLLMVPKTSVVPVIDGELDDVWHNVGETQCLITEMANATSAAPEDWHDLFATFKAMYDDNNFYIFVEVQDSVIDTTFSNHQGDSIEIYFDGDNSKGSTYDGVNDNQIRISVDDVDLTNIDSSLPVDGTAFKVLLTDLGYNIEAAFPLEALQIYPSADPAPVYDANGVEISGVVSPNNIIGFEMQINDNDGGGGRETIMRWYSDDNNSYRDASLFGEARLISRTVGDMLDVGRVNFGVNIDGVMEGQWKGLPEITCNKYVLTNSDLSKQNDYTDARFSFRTGWDDQNIYFFVSIIDDIFYDLQTNHQADGIEIFFDADNSKGTTQADGRYDALDDVQLRINHADLTPADIDITGGQYTPANVTKDNINFAVVDTWIGYDIEFAIPLADLAIPAQSGHVFGFDIGLNDADEDIRDNIRKYWSGDNDNWRYPALFGEAVLMSGQ